MKWFTRTFVLALAVGSMIGMSGCDDNEKSSGISSAPTEAGTGTGTMTPQDYVKKQSSTGPAGYPGAKKATKPASSPAAPK